MHFCALRGFCYFPCRRGGGMINFWGDFTFFLFSFPSTAQPLAAKSSLPQGLFLFSAFFLENGHLAQKTIVYARFSLASQEAAPALPAQRGTKDASGLCMGLAKSSKGGVRPQHFSKPGSNERDVPRRSNGAGVCLSKERRFDEKTSWRPNR